MTWTMVREKENPLIERREILLEYHHSRKGTPKNVDVLKMVSEFLKADPEVVSVRKIAQVFGRDVSRVDVYVYASKEGKARFEVIKKKPKKAAKPGEEAKT